MPNLKIAELSDTDDVISRLRKFHTQSSYSQHTFDEQKVRELVSGLIASSPKDSIVLLSRDGEETVGFLMSAVTECLFNRERFAIELVVWLDEEYRTYPRFSELEGAYTFWAKSVAECSLASMAALDERTPSLYKRKGYRLTEVSYSKDL